MNIKTIMLGFFLIGSLIASDAGKNTAQNNNIEIHDLEKQLDNLEKFNDVLKRKFKNARMGIWKEFFNNKEITHQTYNIIFSDICREEAKNISKIINRKDQLIAEIEATRRIVELNQVASTKMVNLLSQAQEERDKENIPPVVEKPKEKETTTPPTPTQTNDSNKGKDNGKNNNKNEDTTKEESLPLLERLKNFIFEHQVISTITGIGAISGAGYAVYTWYNKKNAKKNMTEKDTIFDDFINNHEESNDSSAK